MPVPSLIKNELRRIRSALWFRPALFCVAAAGFAIGLPLLGDWIADDVPLNLQSIEVGDVKQLLRLMAGAMLTVTTVTMSVLVLTLSLAAGQASPRSVPELMADPVTQNALGSFLATFVFSLAALFMLELGSSRGASLTLVFAGSLLLAVITLKYLVQWIHHVADSMKINRIVQRIHRQTERCLDAFYDRGDSEPAAAWSETSGGASEIHATQAGYVQLIDVHGLDRLAETCDLSIELLVREGDFVRAAMPVLTVRPSGATENIVSDIQKTVVIGAERSLEGDPLLGFELLAEVACRALSPSVNDPQTAILCVNYLGALLAQAAALGAHERPSMVSTSGRVKARPVTFEQMLKRAVRPIVRDGAGTAEVVFQIVDMLNDLSATRDGAILETIRAEAKAVGEYGAKRLILERDLNQLAERIGGARAG